MEPSPNRIVVGVDGSAGSARALRWALRAAMASGADVEAILVWSDPWAILGPPSLLGAGKAGLARLKGLVAECVRHAVAEEEAGSVHISERVVAGSPSETLVAESKTAQLLVVGRTGLTGLRRWMIGSVSQRCAQLADIPVVIIPSPHDHHAHEHEPETAEVASHAATPAH